MLKDMATLSVTRQQEIDDVVESVRVKTRMSYPDSNLLDVAEKLGVKVYYLDFSKFKSEKKEINGVINWKKEDGKEPYAEIYINKDFPSERKKFTLAHELGHYMLHPNEMKLRVDVYDYSKDSKESVEESEANYFAASLLMPRDEFEKVLGVSNGDLRITAKYFGVSMRAAETRLAWIHTN